MPTVTLIWYTYSNSVSEAITDRDSSQDRVVVKESAPPADTPPANMMDYSNNARTDLINEVKNELTKAARTLSTAFKIHHLKEYMFREGRRDVQLRKLSLGEHHPDLRRTRGVH